MKKKIKKKLRENDEIEGNELDISGENKEEKKIII